jgi:aminomethyltransferase
MTTQLLKKTPLHQRHLDLGAKMVGFAGYDMPVRYTSDIEEHKAVREQAGLFDVSHMGEFIIKGPKALDLIQRVSSNDASKLIIGKAQYSCLPNAQGGIIDDLLVYQTGEEEYLLVVNASNIQKDWDWIQQHNTEGAEMRNVSADYALLALQGPKANDILQSLTETQLSDIPFYHFATGTVGGVGDIIISATGYTGAGGFELYVPAKTAEKVWDAVMEAGKEHGLVAAGLAARDTLRLEMGFCLYGNDINDTTSPIEAGLGWITKFTKNFVNAENLKAEKEVGPRRKLIGLKMLERGIPRAGYLLHNEAGDQVGHITSGTQSPMLGYGIAMGYVETAYTKPGTPLQVAIRNRMLKAEVVKMPFVGK